MSHLYFSLIFFLILHSHSESHNSWNGIVQYLKGTHNLVAKDLLLFVEKEATQENLDNADLSIAEIISSHPYGMVAVAVVVRASEEATKTLLPFIQIQFEHQLIAAFSLGRENIQDSSSLVRSSQDQLPFALRPFFTPQVSSIFNFTQFHWTHNILHFPSHPTLPPNILSLAAALNSTSNYFSMNSKLRVIYSTATTPSFFELYSVSGVPFVSPTALKPYSYPNGSTYNFKGAVIRATAVDERIHNPVVTYDSGGVEGPKFLRGLGVFDLWDIRDMLNFTIFAMKGDADITAGDASDNFLPLGIGRQIYEGDADVSILHSYHLPDTVRHIKPLVAMGQDRIYAVFQQPPEFTVRNAFSKPFHNKVWTIIGSLWVGVIIVLWVCSGSLGKPLEYTELTLFCVATFCQRSFFSLPTSTTLRIAFTTALLFSYFVYAMYSAEIISSFTAQSFPINSLDDLVKHEFQLLSDPRHFYSYALMPKSSTMHEKQVYGLELEKTFESDYDAIRQVADGFKMNFNTLDTLYLFARELNYSDQEICEIYDFIPLGKLYLTSGFYVKKNSPLQEPFNLKLMVIMERGLNARYIGNYYEETIVKCPKSVKSYREDLGIEDVFSAFLIMSAGTLTACAFLFIEIIRNLWKIKMLAIKK